MIHGPFGFWRTPPVQGKSAWVSPRKGDLCSQAVVLSVRKLIAAHAFSFLRLTLTLELTLLLPPTLRDDALDNESTLFK
jgi:hypothetical protein